MRISDPLIELLAIKLYEHDTAGDGRLNQWPERKTCWFALADEDRDIYRRMARGEEPVE